MKHGDFLLETLNFARCQRPDGTYYGTAGKCRKGTLVGAKVASMADSEKVAKTTPKSKAELRDEYRSLLKEQSELFSANKTKEAMALSAKIEQARDAWERAPTAEEEAKKSAPSETTPKSSKAPTTEKIGGETYSPLEEGRKFDATFEKLYLRQNSVRSSLSEKDLAAIKDYSADEGSRSFSDLNSCLRRPRCLDKDIKAYAAELDAAIKKLPANTDGDRFFRVVNVDFEGGEELYEFLRNAKPGTKIRDPGFGSFSLDRTVTEFFLGSGKNILFESRSKELRPAFLYSTFPTEYEAILPRGTKSTIRGVREDGNTLIVEVD